MPPKRSRAKNSLNGTKPFKAQKTNQPKEAPESSTSSTSHEEQQRITSSTINEIFNFPKQFVGNNEKECIASILVGTTELQLLKLRVKQQHNDELQDFCNYLNVSKILFSSINSDSIYYQVEIIGSAGKVAAAIVELTYYLYNQTQQKIFDNVGTINTKNYTVTLLVNQYVFNKIDKLHSILSTCETFGVTLISLSTASTFEFSNLSTIIIKSSLPSLFNSLAHIISFYDSNIAVEVPAIDLPHKHYLKYRNNPTYQMNPNDGFLDMSKRTKLINNQTDLGDYIAEYSDAFQNNILGDSLIKESFLRIPYLGMFHDPDLTLKDDDGGEKNDDELLTIGDKAFTESWDKMKTYIEHLNQISQ